MNLLAMFVEPIALQIPFSLCLRVWDIYMMYGERVLTAMAYTILKVHKTKLLRMKDMDQVTDFLQVSFDADEKLVISNLLIYFPFFLPPLCGRHRCTNSSAMMMTM